MKRAVVCAIAFAACVCAAPPTIVELRPRGAEKGRAFTLTVAGRDIPEGAKIWSTMPASFTPVTGASSETMNAAGRTAQFLVEPKGDVMPGVYPVRLESPTGISNVLLFTVGTLPEFAEQESLPYSAPNRNDSIENAEPVPATSATVNGTLKGAERDVYRVYGKLGETRIFEVESRRCGSAIDPVLRILDGSGNQLAKSDDSPGTGLDPRLEFKFPKEGYYYVEVRDARYSTQVQNFYRLKTGVWPYADSVFPLGVQRGAKTPVTVAGGNLPAPAKLELAATGSYATVSIPNSASLPFVLPVSDVPEMIEPSAPVSAPAAINGRLSQPGEADRYVIQAQPGDKLLIEVQARELGLSKIEAVLTAEDESGRKIDSAGDKPLPEDVFAVQGSSRTSSDPFLNVTVPQGSNRVILRIEDLAGRGGAHYPYRILLRKEVADFRLSLATPFVNIPKGGSALVVVSVDRRGYDGPIAASVANLPAGIRAEGGHIPRELLDAKNNRTFNRRGVLILTAEENAELSPRELTVVATGKLDDGTVLRRTAAGPGIAIEVAGATDQGVVDRQRSLTAPWLGLTMPGSTTAPTDATLEVKQVNFTRMEEGDRYDFAYTWSLRAEGVTLPAELAVEIVGARDTRVTAFEKKGPNAGTFSINITKATDPATYDVIVRGRIRQGGMAEEIYARPVSLKVTERRSNVQAASAQ
ncbi:MAG TPA: PPC domain-containing protein [Bryobacteraceae bacterium]|nr:PPC domain-containing protein [Bryobacteraceae bacterium]